MNSSYLITTLKEAGMRITPQRLAICSMLENTDQHPTAQQIYELLRPQFPTMSLATVYNTLDTLVQVGAVNELGSAGDNSVHYDADVGPHINLACISCHRVIDLPSQFVGDLDHEVEEHSGYKLLGARILYYGICPDCNH
ncbi:MAG: transcriptional repressor [Chloroflexi bacterium]|nr:MAG: transcriptional repressor [Chloroflexota bacterium]